MPRRQANRLLDVYYDLKDHEVELRESGSTSDFPNLLGNLMYRSLIDWAHAQPDAWRAWARLGELTDFRPGTRIVGYEAEDLLPVGQDGGYQDSKLADAQYQLTLATYGRAFSINRTVIINDDLNYIRQQPVRWGRAAGRSIGKFAAQTILEGNGACFDGIALFHTSHSNIATGGGSVLSSANLQTAIAAMQQQTILGGFQAVMAKWLIVPPQLQFTARQILNSSIVVAAGGDSTASTKLQTVGNENPLNGALGMVIEPFLSSTTAYYVIADPADTHVVELGFLLGKQSPDLLVERPVMMNLAGGDDEYEFEYDVMRYKVRYDYAGNTALWWGGYKFAGA